MDGNKEEDQVIEEVSRKLDKSDFKVMKMIGQFNKGFILTQMESDVFVIDQHASDERQNFDHLLNTCELEGQKLISSQPMSLSPYQENILKENMQVFVRNGFRFEFDSSKVLGTRFSLTCLPSYGDKILGISDAEELLEAIENAPAIASNLRPSRVKEILAMKACKKAIKIGDSLPKEKMRAVVDGMSETNNPWICAHGRPTIRFLTKLN